MSKFVVVGGVTFLIDSAMFFILKTTVLAGKPMTANILAILIATIVNYILSREWAFAHRGGRQRKHEAALFFLFSGIGIVLATIPLWVSNYMLDLRVPYVSQTVENTADFISAKYSGPAWHRYFAGGAHASWFSRKASIPEANHPVAIHRFQMRQATGSATLTMSGPDTYPPGSNCTFSLPRRSLVAVVGVRLIA